MCDTLQLPQWDFFLILILFPWRGGCKGKEQLWRDGDEWDWDAWCGTPKESVQRVFWACFVLFFLSFFKISFKKKKKNEWHVVLFGKRQTSRLVRRLMRQQWQSGRQDWFREKLPGSLESRCKWWPRWGFVLWQHWERTLCHRIKNSSAKVGIPAVWRGDE